MFHRHTTHRDTMFGYSRIITTHQQAEKLLPIDKIRSILHMNPSVRDMTISHYRQLAIWWTQDRLGKTLIKATRETKRYNNQFLLPYGPVIEVTKVTYGKECLTKDRYELETDSDSAVISVPFSWKDKALVVEYTAGYATEEEVPGPLKNAVLSVIEYVANHDGKIGGIEDSIEPWVSAHKTYRLF